MKPRIKKYGPLWICQNLFTKGVGFTPYKAYWDWLANERMRKINLPYISTQAISSKCMYDNLSEEDKKRPMGLFCPCPKCNPFSITMRSTA